VVDVFGISVLTVTSWGGGVSLTLVGDCCGTAGDITVC
jgi:hypothetical protein